MLKTRLGKIILATAIGAGALGVGFGASLAVASAATTPASSTSSSSGGATTTVNAGSVSTAWGPSPTWEAGGRAPQPEVSWALQADELMADSVSS